MANTQIIYDGNTIADLTDGQTAVMNCRDKKMASDVIVSGACSVEYQGSIIAEPTEGQKATLLCNGKMMASNILVKVVESGSGDNGESGGTDGEPVSGTEGLAYVLNADGVSYSCAGIGTATETDIVIASEYNGKPVTKIRNSAFANCNSVKSVIIPNSVTSIESMAFAQSNSLKSVVIPLSVVTLESSVFRGSYSVTVYVEHKEKPSGWNNYWASQPDGEIKVVWGYTASNLITFTIAGTTYQAENGMTWGEWIDSKYNVNSHVDNFDPYVSCNGVLVFDVPNSTVANSAGAIKLADEIIDGKKYYQMVGGW